MALHPIAVVDEVIQEYKSYLTTEFRASDLQLRQALEEAINERGFLAQEPFFQAHRPFKEGKRWRELGLDEPLAEAIEERSETERAYLHQSDAITHLFSDEATPLAVTTGTGSGKTECFLLPAIQNAIEDSIRFKRSGITALLVYPMNALANDQEERIEEYLQKSGHTHVRVERYDRSTKQDKREQMRKNPPHILLTNYMMLEYLLIRPADRTALFANHRCRFVVLDEVHTYRGSLGANIALLFRRLMSHLRHAQQDWQAGDKSGKQRFPHLIPVATSATIKSVDETGLSPEEITRRRDEAVQAFLGQIIGEEPARIRVIGESIRDLEVPKEARWPQEPVDVPVPDHYNPAAVRQTLAALAGLPSDALLEQSIRAAAILWTLNDLLARRPLSVSGIVERILEEIPQRQGANPEAVRREVEVALVAGSALPDGMVGALRLRTHRFIRGGWKFHRCVDPACGKLYPMGEEHCSVCGKATAPLYLCRSCGADALRFRSEDDDPEDAPLEPNDSRTNENEWVLYNQERHGEGDEEDLIDLDTDRQLRRRPILRGSFDPVSRQFSKDESAYPVRVVLAPARNQCLVCGAFAGSGNILTTVGLGTSAAVRVVAEGLVEGLAEQNTHKPDHDNKERLLIFADSRQDAAHQARFITYTGRYDRMRRLLVRVLQEAGEPLSIDRAVQELMVCGVTRHDNPCTTGFDDPDFLPEMVQERAKAWEEAPLLDDLAVSAAYRATVFNLGLVGVRYQKLNLWVEKHGDGLAAELGIGKMDLLHLCRCLLDEIRRRAALSRPMLIYHPSNPNCPEEFCRDADWERRVKTAQGFTCNSDGEPVGYLDQSEVPPGINPFNLWRRPKAGGRSPRLERLFKELLTRMGGAEGTEDRLLETVRFLMGGLQYIQPARLFGYRKPHTLLQVNAETIHLELLGEGDCFRCSICNVRMPWVEERAPCLSCQGIFQAWPENEVRANRYVRRILKSDLLPLVAGEHTAQITSDDRLELEEGFKGPPEKSPINVLYWFSVNWTMPSSIKSQVNICSYEQMFTCVVPM